jgi:hypothetical protein
VKPRDAAIGRNPVLTRACFEKIVYVNMRQSARYCVIDELAAIEPGQAFIGADPQKASRVTIQTVHVIVSQALRGGVDSNR